MTLITSRGKSEIVCRRSTLFPWAYLHTGWVLPSSLWARDNQTINVVETFSPDLNKATVVSSAEAIYYFQRAAPSIRHLHKCLSGPNAQESSWFFLTMFQQTISWFHWILCVNVNLRKCFNLRILLVCPLSRACTNPCACRDLFTFSVIFSPYTHSLNFFLFSPLFTFLSIIGLSCDLLHSVAMPPLLILGQ